MKKIPENDFPQQRRKERSLSLLPLNASKVIWHGKSWGLCLSRSVYKNSLTGLNLSASC